MVEEHPGITVFFPFFLFCFFFISFFRQFYSKHFLARLAGWVPNESSLHPFPVSHLLCFLLFGHAFALGYDL